MQILELAEKLEMLGLSEKEARVYVAALFLGPSSVQKIASQAQVTRPNTYVVLEQLAELGLVSQSTEAKKTVFVAESPAALSTLIERQNQIVKDRQRQLNQILPELDKVNRKDSDDAPVARFFRGKEGIVTVNTELRRKAHRGDEIYGLVNYDKVEEIFPEVLQNNPKARLNKRLSSKLIYSYTDKEMPSDPKLLRKTKKVDEPIAADISLFQDTAAFSTYGNIDSIGIAIESPEIVKALRQLFEMAWDNQK